METMAVKAAVTVLEKLVTFLGDEAQSMAGVGLRVSSLKDDLEFMHSYLKIAESIDDKDDGLKIWVKQVRDVAYETEDVVEEFLLLLTPPSHHFLRTWIFHLQGLKARHRLSGKIELINLKMKGIKERRETFSLPPRAPHDELGGMRLDALFIDETSVVGIDHSKTQLISMLNVGDKDLLIVTVVGMGGVGKSTLVKKVYDSLDVKGHFDCHAWITVSQSFTGLELLRSSLKRFKNTVINEEVDKMEKDQLIDALKNYLQKKRYIIVFDDIWSVEAWDQIKYAFPCFSCGSRIIFTTRNGDITSSTETTNRMFNLNPLSDEESLTLFCMRAFRGECPEEMHDISRSMMKKCGGLPLAIVCLGSLLARKEKDVLEWQQILESLSPETRIISELERLERILLFSYNDLPNHLKCCILYTSMFPEDYLIKRSRLIRLWVSEGFVEEKPGYTRGEVAESYLTELVNRSMIQIVSKNNFNRIKTCQLHDVLRDVLQRKSRDKSFSIVLNDEKLLQSSEKIHRAAIYKGANISLFTGLRSLLLFIIPKDVITYERLLKTYLYGCRSLRVVDLENVPLFNIPEVLTEIIHLKHLGLRRTMIRNIPDSIRKLRYLEILDLKFCFIKSISQGILDLKNLRQLHYSSNVYPLVSISAVKVPSGIKDLTKLEKLHGFEIDRRNYDVVEEIGNLTNLKSLSVLRLTDQLYWARLSSSLEKLERLTTLYLLSGFDKIVGENFISSSSFDRDLLTSLFAANALPSLCYRDCEPLSLTLLSPPPHLQRLYIDVRLQSLPSWIFSLSHLGKLVLQSSGLKNDPLRALQGLENLVVLHLRYDSYSGEELSCDIGSYPKLKELHLGGLPLLERIVLTKGAMPRLRELHLQNCPSLQTVPTGIQHLKDLQYLSLLQMPEILSQNIEPLSPDFWKVDHIPIIKRVDYL